MKGGRMRIFGGPPVEGRKDRDEDLLLFLEMQRREKERTINLLQPVSDEFEPNYGSLTSYRKNDYDWLKTPPATPLFPSLEMEANGPILISQKEIPIIQPIKFPLFSGRSEAPTADSDTKSPVPTTKRSSSRPATPKRSSTSGPAIPKRPVASRPVTPKRSPSLRPVTPKRKPYVAVSKASNATAVADTNEQTAETGSRPNKQPIYSSTNKEGTTPKEIPKNQADTNRPKSNGGVTDPTHRSRGVSPSLRARIPATIHGLPSETPLKQQTGASDGSSSISMGRLGNPIPKMTDTKQDNDRQRNVGIVKERGTKGKTLAGNGSMLVGSSMVRKVMNARKSDIGEERDLKPKFRI